MRKIGIILFLGMLSWNCSVTRRSRTEVAPDSIDLMSVKILKSVQNQNITNKSFFIQKADIEILTESGKEKFIANIKFEYPDKFLISIKSRTGIEGARIYINKDSILVNDRINKKMYFGNSYYFKKKYGLDQSFFPLIFGDLIIDKEAEENSDKCLGDKLNLSLVVNGVLVNYDIDCKKRKTVLAKQNNTSQENIKIKYDKFLKLGNILIPGIVELEEPQYNTIIKIKIVKVEYPWNGSVRFIPGKGYDLIELL